MMSAHDAEAAAAILGRAQRILCICHRNPDGDAIGALLGMGLLLEQAFGSIEVSFHCVDPVPEPFLFLTGAQRVKGVPVLRPGDAAVFLDCAEPKLSEMHVSLPQLFDRSVPTVNIDHHPSNTRYGGTNLVLPEASSTCEILVELSEHLHWALNSDIATALLTGIYTDTGGLLHSNTTAQVYRTVAKLLRLGAQRNMIVSSVFRTAKLSTLKLWGRVLEKISITEEGGAVSAVTEGDFRATGALHAELTGAIDYVNAVPGMRFSMVLSERAGIVKGSLRTLRDDVDVSAMASTFSGGGHKKAAGFALPGKLKPEVRWKVIEEQES
jgi:phosphoesterase RecJ-like protein